MLWNYLQSEGAQEPSLDLILGTTVHYSKNYGLFFSKRRKIPGEREDSEPKEPCGPGASGGDEWHAVQFESVPGRP